MSSFSLLDELNEEEIIHHQAKQKHGSKKKSKKHSLYREEFSWIANDEVIWFHVLTFLDFKYLFQSCTRIDKMRCDMIYAKSIGHLVLMSEFKTMLNGEEEQDTRVWFQKFMPFEPLNDLLNRVDPLCQFKEIRDFVTRHLNEQTASEQEAPISQHLQLKLHGTDHYEFRVFVKLFHKLWKRRNRIRNFNMKIRMRYPQHKIPSCWGDEDTYRKSFHIPNQAKHDEDRRVDQYQSHIKDLDLNSRRQYHCDHFENVIRMADAHIMISQCKACGVSMEISQCTPEILNKKRY
ncbi:hypothetical protein C9374_005727 [Naegleria lovaniensis]|uniref:Uncharacterized protein n=1 Tax=Naegleria lovaniensis TaxID=51637 RepID=A0AA88KJU9_NAELO|nr:uncharacterized protein C9374_005727 [Naegleria lovaniensis]KAG2381935.1 hypothetical protein C9374_005727 [Naegleria lovaniensis]